MNVFKELALSVLSAKSYEKYLEDKKGKVFLFGVLLAVFYFILSTAAPLTVQIALNGGVSGFLHQYVPDFKLTGGKLWVEREVEYESYDKYIYINTSPDFELYGAGEIESLIREYTTAVLMDSDKMIIKREGQVEEITLDTFPDVSFDSILSKYLPLLILVFAVLMLIILIFIGMGVFLGALLVALIGMLVASCMKCRLTFGQLFAISIHARTPALLLKGILSLLWISIPFFFLINFGISLFYLAEAIRKMKEKPPLTPLEFTTGSPEDNNNWNH